MQITRSTIDTEKGPADWFTGDVYIYALAEPGETRPAAAALVHFMPGARTPWHRDPLSQTIFVVEGLGLCQRDGGASRSSAPATASSSSRTRSTGTARRRTDSWSTSRSSRPTTLALPSPARARHRRASTPLPRPATAQHATVPMHTGCSRAGERGRSPRASGEPARVRNGERWSDIRHIPRRSWKDGMGTWRLGGRGNRTGRFCDIRGLHDQLVWRSTRRASGALRVCARGRVGRCGCRAANRVGAGGLGGIRPGDRHSDRFERALGRARRPIDAGSRRGRRCRPNDHRRRRIVHVQGQGEARRCAIPP